MKLISRALTLAAVVFSLMGLSAQVHADSCSGKHITIHAIQGTGEINVTPTVFREKKGCGFDIHVPRNYTTRIISDQGWLSGSSDGAPIHISIPEGLESGDYKYDIEIVDFGYLDPRIVVY